MAEPVKSKAIVLLTAAELEGLDAMAASRHMSRAALLRKLVQRVLAGEAARVARNEVTPRFKK